ncbi:hypothetical protein V6N13_043807 [Hibiscus sabdariffa]|uniref:Uncharacterized protein n=1 Tax=Hibiscus sabdariffa TaxID=183260 RepID=A0ABR2RGS6_9ROSI
MSIEALAMAGVDYKACGIEFEAWEHEQLEQTPPHLLAEPNSSREVEKEMIGGSGNFLFNELSGKAKMVESVRAVASSNHTTFKTTNVLG